MVQRPDRLVLAVFLGAVLIGGSNYVGVRLSNRELDPLWGAGLRFTLAAAVLGLLCAALRLPLPRGRPLALVLVYGVVGFGVVYGTVYWAMQEAPAGVAAIVFAIGPLLTLLLAVAHGLERLSVRTLAGAVIAVAGSGLMFLEPGESSVGWASFALLGVSVLAASEAVVISKLAGRQHPVAMSFVAMCVGAVVLLAGALLAGEELALPADGETQAALAYLVAATVILFLSVLYVVQRWEASATAYSFVLMPVVAVALGAVVAGEPVTAAVVVGGAIVTAGVYLGALGRRQASVADGGGVPLP